MGWACLERAEGPTAGGALKPEAESRSGSFPGPELGAGMGATLGLWLLGQRQRMAAVHTARGSSESKHLRSTPAGHEKSCPVIALCPLGSPRQARRGPVSCDSGHSGLATQARGIKYRDAPSPHPTPLLLPTTQQHLPHPCWALSEVWALYLSGPHLGGGVEVGGASDYQLWTEVRWGAG